MDLIFPYSLSFSLNKFNYLSSFVIVSIELPTSLEHVETSQLQHINFCCENHDLKKILPFVSF